MHQIGASSLPVELHPSGTRMVMLLLGSMAFVAIGVWQLPAHMAMGYASIGFFGLCALVFLLQLHPKCSYLSLRPEGFTFCALFRKHEVKWADARAFTTVRIGPNKTVGWSYSNQFHAHARMRVLNRALAGIDAALPDSYGMRPEDLASLLNQLRSHFVVASDA
ncbi:MAG: STM3941 family protein [Rhodanobacteraceae bacterium]